MLFHANEFLFFFFSFYRNNLHLFGRTKHISSLVAIVKKGSPEDQAWDIISADADVTEVQKNINIKVAMDRS